MRSAAVARVAGDLAAALVGGTALDADAAAQLAAALPGVDALRCAMARVVVGGVERGRVAPPRMPRARCAAAVRRAPRAAPFCHGARARPLGPRRTGATGGRCRPRPARGCALTGVSHTFTHTFP